MRFFYFFSFSQIMVFLVIAWPGHDLYRIALLAFWLWGAVPHPLASLLGALWQMLSLHPQGEAGLRCDPRFWFICTSDAPNLLVTYLDGTRLGRGAALVRDWTLERCQSWDPLWGRLAYSLIMGGQPDERLKALYKNLGFLHVLVVSGSQFSLLGGWLKYLCRLPFTLLYAAGIIDWRLFRPLRFLADFLTLMGLLLYLLASGASPPCQRAFLQQLLQLYRLWCAPPRGKGRKVSAARRIFMLQMLLFPEAWFSLSNLLSWGAVQALRIFHVSRNFFAQLRTSLGIQLLSLAIFSRLSISALLFDFFVSPLWDLLLGVCLIGIFIPELHLQKLLSLSLDFFHDRLWAIDLWQGDVFGSSALVFRPFAAWWGRLLAGLCCLFLWLSPRPLKPTPKR